MSIENAVTTWRGIKLHLKADFFPDFFKIASSWSKKAADETQRIISDPIQGRRYLRLLLEQLFRHKVLEMEEVPEVVLAYVGLCQNKESG